MICINDNIKNMEIKFTKLKCKRCNYEWLPRKEELPITCPKCRSPYWRRERINKKKEK
ncbi:MAG: hypothetical protein WDA59_11080 [Methanofastidiosum sp.]|jgi:Zn finger protein HypA/HybF involved in hydrogenase expression|nr:hypothetical protein [Defluviitaleaceae bacterium]